ncbi:sensor histidine kinase [Chromatium okenii]|uniref:sensor histidine kinase n=1 Tax=Chromatium okenii TaxID=61644 RepID=UPI001F5BC5FA|nr:ATP-binding protein [Chromatium okenii]
MLGLTWVFSATLFAPTIDSRFIWLIISSYSVLMLLGGLTLVTCWPLPAQQVQISIFIDIIAYTLLMHLAGGIGSGLGVLLAVAVAAAALMMEGRLSLLFAAIASLAVIAQQGYSALLSIQSTVSFTQAGLLGLLFFTVAMMSHVLYRRIQSAEALAARRKVDIDDLSKLNDFIIHSINTGILVVDGEQRLRLFNRAALALFTAKRLRIGAPLASLSRELSQWLQETFIKNPKEQGLSIQATQNLQLYHSPPEEKVVLLNNSEIRVSLKLLGADYTSGIILYLRDNQEAMNEAQQIKLAALGTLTASIAHNIRNPLSAMIHAGELLSESTALHDDDLHLLDIMRRNGARIEETVQSVLQLSRRNQHQPTYIMLLTWLEDFIGDFREQHHLSAKQLQLFVPITPTTIEVDPRHLHQIFANLCENALIHGCIDTESAHIVVQVHDAIAPCSIQVDISDNGPGIPPNNVDDIFNPFYTTKSNGTGLGLYIARELADTNGIRLSYTPLTPHGSCFCLNFRTI